MRQPGGVASRGKLASVSTDFLWLAYHVEPAVEADVRRVVDPLIASTPPDDESRLVVADWAAGRFPHGDAEVDYDRWLAFERAFRVPIEEFDRAQSRSSWGDQVVGMVGDDGSPE